MPNAFVYVGDPENLHTDIFADNEYAEETNDGYDRAALTLEFYAKAAQIFRTLDTEDSSDGEALHVVSVEICVQAADVTQQKAASTLPPSRMDNLPPSVCGRCTRGAENMSGRMEQSVRSIWRSRSAASSIWKMSSVL